MSITQKRQLDWSIPLKPLTTLPVDGIYRIVGARYVQLPVPSTKLHNADYVLFWLENTITSNIELLALLYGKVGASATKEAEIPPYNPFGQFIIRLSEVSDYDYISLPNTNELSVLIGWEFVIKNSVVVSGTQYRKSEGL